MRVSFSQQDWDSPNHRFYPMKGSYRDKVAPSRRGRIFAEGKLNLMVHIVLANNKLTTNSRFCHHDVMALELGFTNGDR